MKILWAVWCWALDICSNCEQTFPYHAKTCGQRGKWQDDVFTTEK